MSIELSLVQTNGQTDREAILWVYELLLAQFGPQKWWPGDSSLEVIVGAVLTQATAWRNVESALGTLKQAGALNLTAMLTIDEAELAQLIRPAGFFRVKARRLRAFFVHLAVTCGGDLDAFLSQEPSALREALLSIRGIGPETADSIALYAAGYPFFVIDAYTTRIWRRVGHTPEGENYGDWQEWFQRYLPNSGTLFNEYHALMVRLGKESCRPEPLCGSCCLQSRCMFAKAQPIAP